MLRPSGARRRAARALKKQKTTRYDALFRTYRHPGAVTGGYSGYPDPQEMGGLNSGCARAAGLAGAVPRVASRGGIGLGESHGPCVAQNAHEN